MRGQEFTTTTGVHYRGYSKELVLNSKVKAVPRAFTSKKNSADRYQEISIKKRFLDVALSLLGIILLLPFLPVIALLINISSPGPIFFVQERNGKNGEPFMCYKFRTMDAESKQRKENGEPNITKKGDERIFPFGQFMRDNNIDELPQLYNVLKGDMSLVGPRPYMVVECEFWKEEFEDFEKRERVKPGMSGLAQINGYRGGILDKEHMRTRLGYDLIYLESHTTRVDLMIIWRTIMQMIHLKTNAH